MIEKFREKRFSPEKQRMKWRQLDIGKIEDFCNKTYERYSEYPSIRDIFYAFVGEWFSNTKASYQGLVKLLVKKRLSKEIDWHIIRDGSGREIYTGDGKYESPEDYFKSWLDSFKTCPERYKLPKWTNQRNMVFILCEKEADYPIVKSIVSELNVNVGFMRGFSGKRIMFEIAEEFKRCGKTPKIFTLGDFDPSGSGKGGIKENVVNDLRKMGMDVSVVTDLAITRKQIQRFRLPHTPESPEEIKKLQDDPRFKKWKYGLYRVETASLRVRQPEYFDNLLKLKVLKCFDQATYKKVKEKEKRERRKIRPMVTNALTKEDEI